MARIPLDLPKPPEQVFSLATPAHVLDKLHWELRNLKEKLQSLEDELFGHLHASYMAFNFSVTAWHLCDWVWHSLSKGDQKLVMAELDPTSTKIDIGSFRAAIARSCRELRICQQIANGSKHMKYERADNSVRAATKWRPVPSMSSKASNDSARYRIELLVWDNGREREALEVFETAIHFWERLLAEGGFIEDTVVLPEDGDFGEQF